MHVIGVAEPDPSSNEAEILAARRYMLYEQEIGDRMGRMGDVLMEVGVWGCWGLRRRVMVWRLDMDTAWSVLTRGLRLDLQIIFVEALLATDADLPRRGPTAPYRTLARRTTYTSGLEGAGLYQTYLPWQVHPSQTALDPVSVKPKFPNGSSYSHLPSRSEEFMGAYVNTHLAAYIFFQRSGILPGFRLPSPLFFLPFTSSSPIAAPAPPADLSISSILTWLGAAAVNAGPIILLALWRKLYSRVVARLGMRIFLSLPNINLIVEPQITPDLLPDPASLFRSSDQPAPGQVPDEGPGTQPSDVLIEDAPAQPPTGGASSRRPSAFSGRADDYGSEEEDNGAISGTLISFDVEATESTDAPPPQSAQGIWSAELRPTPATDARSPGGQPAVYLRNTLTKQPLVHAAKVLSRLAACLLLSPLEAAAHRALAVSYCAVLGLPSGHVWEPLRLLTAMSWRWVTNFLAVELVHLSLQTDLWAGVALLGRWYHLTPEEWSEMTAEEHAEFVREIE